MRGRPFLFPILSALSILLCMAIGVLWMRNDLFLMQPGSLGWRHFETHERFGYTVSEAHPYGGPEIIYAPTDLAVAAAVFLTAILPIRWLAGDLRQRKRWTRIAAGLCPSCGYDLHATPLRCPECGNVPTHLKADQYAHPAP